MLPAMLAFCRSSAISADTGSFEKTILFNNEQRTVSYYVPTDYNPEKKYGLLISLHGLGDNSTNMRYALINVLKWNELLPNTIFAFLDGGSDQMKDFYTPAGDEDFIRVAMDSVMKNYAIDESKIILEGFSLGGRSALKYGLEHTEVFSGLLLNTPALQGVLDINNDSLYSLNFKYENAAKMPIAITCGVEDYAYSIFVPQVYKKLIEKDGVAMLDMVAGMSHNVPGTADIKKCLDFIDKPASKASAAELTDISAPKRTCSPGIAASCNLRNTGSEKLTSCTLSYDLNGSVKEFSWTGELASFGNVAVALPELSLKDGANLLKVKLLKLNDGGEVTDTSTTSASNEIVYTGPKPALPFTEGFEEENNTDYPWLLDGSGHWFTWTVDNSAAKTGSNALFMFNTILAYNNKGLSENISSPIVDFTSVAKPSLSFQVAYNYHKYTPPYFTGDVVFADTLEIYASTDCGSTYEPIFKKGGAELATVAEPIVNPLSIDACLFTPSAGEWRKEVIDLAQFAGKPGVSFRFSYKSALGGVIFIDDIRIDTTNVVSVEEEAIAAGRSIYPNPALSGAIVTIQPNGNPAADIKVTDLLGNEVISKDSGDYKSVAGCIELNTKSLAPGVYFIYISDGNTRRVEKLIVE